LTKEEFIENVKNLGFRAEEVKDRPDKYVDFRGARWTYKGLIFYTDDIKTIKSIHGITAHRLLDILREEVFLVDLRDVGFHTTVGRAREIFYAIDKHIKQSQEVARLIKLIQK